MRNFTAAGETVGATQSAVSIRIRKLEQRLLERNPRNVSLTGFGVTFLLDAQRVLELHDDAAVRAIGAMRSRSLSLRSDYAPGDLLPKIQARCASCRMVASCRSWSDGRSNLRPR